MSEPAKRDPMKGFARDQVEAVQIAREEKVGEERDTKASRRNDACHIALRYFDTFTPASTPTVEGVIVAARKFEKYLLEP